MQRKRRIRVELNTEPEAVATGSTRNAQLIRFSIESLILVVGGVECLENDPVATASGSDLSLPTILIVSP